MSADLPALLKRFSVAAGARPAHALQLWISIVAHRDWAAARAGPGSTRPARRGSP